MPKLPTKSIKRISKVTGKVWYDPGPLRKTFMPRRDAGLGGPRPGRYTYRAGVNEHGPYMDRFYPNKSKMFRRLQMFGDNRNYREGTLKVQRAIGHTEGPEPRSWMKVYSPGQASQERFWTAWKRTL